MFNKCVSQTALTTPIMDGYFSNITGDTYREDSTFISTMRALLYERIGENNVRFVFGFANHSEDVVRSATCKGVFDSVNACANPQHEGIYLFQMGGTGENVAEVYAEKFDDPNEGFLTAAEGFRELLDLKTFFAQVMKARFYINEEKRVTFIFAFDLDMRKYHFLQIAISRYLPWYFAEKKLTADERKLVQSLNSRYASDYETAIADVAGKIDIRDHTIRYVVGDFEKRSRMQQVETAKQNIRQIHDRINDNVNTYRQLIEQLDKAEINVAGLQAMVEGSSDSSELIDFIIHNKAFMPIAADGLRIELIVKTYLDSFDPEMYTTMAANGHSHLWNGYSVDKEKFRNKGNKRKLLDAIFGEDGVLKLKACAYYSVDVRGSVDSRRSYNFPREYADCMPNPHLQHHNCLGNHRQFINECLMRGDMIGALSQCLSSARSINIGESATVERFLHDLFSTDAKVIELPDGTSVSPEEALEWLNNNGKKKE